MDGALALFGNVAYEAQQLTEDSWSRLSGHPEMLRRIFVHCMPSWLPTDKPIGDVPFILMQVCRQWKEIALATPQLWSHFRIDVAPTFSDAQFVGFKRALSLWLEYSGTEPLVFALVKQGDTTEQQWPLLRELYLMLRGHEKRWSKALFQVPARVLRARARDVEICSTTLQELELVFGERTAESQWDTGVLPFSLLQCTRLQKIAAQGNQILFLDRLSPSVEELDLRDFHLSVQQLRPEECPGGRESIYYVPCNVHTLVCRNVRLDFLLLACFHIAFPKLRTLAIGYVNHCIPMQQEFARLHERPVEGRFVWLSLLESLSLKIHIWVLLDHLVAPRLRGLEIAEERPEAERADAAWWMLSSRRIIEFIQRNHCALTTLNLKSCSIDEESLLEILRYMPDLVYLDVHLAEHPLSDTFLFKLSLNQPGRVRDVGERILHDECNLCPLLKRLYVAPAVTTTHRFTFPFLTQLVFSRHFHTRAPPPPYAVSVYGLGLSLAYEDEGPRCRCAWEELALPILDVECEELWMKAGYAEETRIWSTTHAQSYCAV